MRTSLLLLGVAACCAMEVRILPEHLRPDPFAGIVAVDQGMAATDLTEIRAARGGYVSAHLAVTGGPAVTVTPRSKLAVEIYREWFHRNQEDGRYYPDALIPYDATPAGLENRIAGQKVRAFWLDFWIAADTPVGVYPVQITVADGADTKLVKLTVRVLPEKIPSADVLTLDHNSYGSSWMFGQYPNTLPKGNEDALFAMIHSYHRVFYEHRGAFHQLGYGHAGKVGPEFAPELSGSGRNKRISSWDRFDRHYGPLLDGSAFRGTRRGAKPIPYAYLPINPEWPASFLWWGEPGYQVELTNVVSAMEKHFREKGWTSTYFELFFNHKKRYKGFSWDGDEVRFVADNDAVIAFRKMFDQAIPRDTPVRFVTRSDTSWSMEDQFERLHGTVNFWVAGEGMLSWYPGSVEKLKARGDQIWAYGGTPAVNKPSASITLNALRSWITGVQGFVRWQTVDPGPDPWFALEGGGETLVYPGDRFGIGAPLSSVRLKLQRNCMQDLARLEAKAGHGSRASVQEEVVQRFNGTTLKDWQNTRPAMASTPVLNWNNVSLEEAQQPFESRFATIRSDAWMRVRESLQ
ncbi:glycoside hydrolase domain-containing protein [Bryobacter aggregatus]|uniref:glycoside hydrolase domain-containing protein n=1 Tax=Bryobacter aggregatus TaxID=360054 RepID=UPI00138E4EC5|nr:glycoside hydrolase domain-containing protein [Bryobacter aggregatus]